MAPHGFIGVDREMGCLEFQIYVSLGNRSGVQVRGGRLIKVGPMEGVGFHFIQALLAEILGRGEAIGPVRVGAAPVADCVDGDQTRNLR